MNGNFNQFINNCDNLDEEISVTDFIKTLKKVESCDALNGKDRDSTSSSSSTDKLAKATDDRKIDKKGSANDLLQTMRKRFVHRATEPIFHALPEAQVSRINAEHQAVAASVAADAEGVATAASNVPDAKKPTSGGEAPTL